MNKTIFSLLLLLIAQFSFCQVKGIVIDSVTKKGIPYVNIWVENEDIGTTSDEKGEFILQNIAYPKTLIFSTIGFETKNITLHTKMSNVELNPKITVLKEVILYTKKQTKEIRIGSFRKSETNHYFGCGIKPWIVAKRFKFDVSYEQTPFLKRIKILTKSDVKDSKFNIRLYDVNEKGEPEGYIYDNNIFGIAKKGKNITEIDISDFNIRFPKTGFFIAFEWLIIEQNKHEYIYTMTGSNKKLNGISYEPGMGSLLNETDQDVWVLVKTNWRKFSRNNLDSKSINKKFSTPAIELTLTN